MEVFKLHRNPVIYDLDIMLFLSLPCPLFLCWKSFCGYNVTSMHDCTFLAFLLNSSNLSLAFLLFDRSDLSLAFLLFDRLDLSLAFLLGSSKSSMVLVK